MATASRTRHVSAEDRVSFYASWDDYQAIARAVGDQHVRLAYDGERVEVMSPGPHHDNFAGLAEAIVRALAAALGLLCKSMRSTRWERPEAARAIESDACFYFLPEKIAVARRRPEKDADWPLPDLAVEIDIRRSRVDREVIYAALRVAEVWRFDGEVVRIRRLGPEGVYADAAESGWLGIRPDEVARLLMLDAADDNDFTNQIVAWARDVLVPRRGLT